MASNATNIRNLIQALQAMQAGVPMEQAMGKQRPPMVENAPPFPMAMPGQPQQVAPAPMAPPQPQMKSVLKNAPPNAR
jgi:hypothetical protein